VGLLTAWTSAAHPARFRLAALSVRWLAPSLICLSLGSTTYMLLNGYKRFFLAAFGDASWKFCLLAALGVGVGLFGVTYEAVLWGLLAGSIAKLATHLLGLRGRLGRLRFSLRLNTPAMRAMGALMLPLICGIVFAKVRDIFNNVTILSCLDTEGLMKANSLGRKLYVTIGWLVPYALSIAMFPFLCELVDREDHRAFARVLSRSCRMLLAVFIPLALVCAALSRPLSSLLFLWGRTSAGDVEWISLSMACYILVLPAAAVEYLLMQAFFAQRRMVSITVAGIAFSALSIAVSYAGIRLAGARGAWALAVVALGFTLSRTLKSVALVVLLKRRLQIFAPGETLLFLARCAAAGLAAAAAGYGGAAAAGGLAGTVTGKIAPLLQLGAGTAAAGAALLGALRLLRIEEPRVMCRWALERLRARRPASEA
jgi:peptidoglycan biosynthesis protein MviN/MurJ (putative lipid II flippase)